jgi:hypothetical protein
LFQVFQGFPCHSLPAIGTASPIGVARRIPLFVVALVVDIRSVCGHTWLRGGVMVTKEAGADGCPRRGGERLRLD